VRTQAQLLLDDASRFAVMNRRKADMSQRRLVADQLLNRTTTVAEPKMRNTQSRLRARDEFDKRPNETMTEWAARMRAESAKVDKNIQKFGVQKQRLRALSNVPHR